MHIGKTTTKSAPERADNECRGESTARKQAEAILAEMNDMLRDRPFFKVYVEKRFDRLNERLHALGWLGLIKKFTRKDGKYYAQLKLVDPNSEEAQRVM